MWPNRLWYENLENVLCRKVLESATTSLEKKGEIQSVCIEETNIPIFGDATSIGSSIDYNVANVVTVDKDTDLRYETS